MAARRGTNEAGRMAGRTWRLLTSVLVATVAALPLAAAQSAAAAESSDPGGAGAPIEVGPGIYLASASASADPSSGSAPRVVPSAMAARAVAPARVVGGSKTKISRWPWQVSIGYLPIPGDAYRKHVCGGSLVAPRVVVTAAHCMTLGPSRNFRPAEEFNVISGRTVLSSRKGREHRVADYFWFVDGNGDPLWDPETIEWDVVFLILDTPASKATIKIAGHGEEAVWAPGRRAFATGWGATTAGTDDEIDPTKSDTLRQARIRMISDSRCDSVYGPILVTDVMACAGVLAGGVDVCSGDSGGPLVVPIARRGGDDYRLVGSTSFADGCALPDTPGVYARLASDPIRGALQAGIEAEAGVDVVGSGAIPSSRFGFGRSTSGAGTARLRVRVPGRGQVRLEWTRRTRGDIVRARRASTVAVTVSPRVRLARKLRRRGGTIRVRVPVIYTPLGGEPRTETTRVRLTGR